MASLTIDQHGLGAALDVFLVLGDSNAVGQGSSASSPHVQSGKVIQYAANGTVSDANDPTKSAINSAQNANTGSSWPAFGGDWYRSTGRRCGFVLTGKSGTTQNATADMGMGNWDTTGALITPAMSALTAAMAAFTAAGNAPVFRGVIVNLGANDGDQIDASVITVGQYTTSLRNMCANLRSTFSNAELPIYLIQTGTNITGGVSDSGYAQVRAAQVSYCFPGIDQYTFLAFANTLGFVARSLMSYGAHYTQAGYNEVGSVLASNILSGNYNTNGGRKLLAQSTAFNPTGTTSTNPTRKMMGCGYHFTPQTSGNFILSVDFTAANASAGDGAAVVLLSGTGAPPANAASETGTVISAGKRWTISAANGLAGGSLSGVLTGLAVGTTYWLDVSLGSLSGNLASLAGVTFRVHEI
jgi:Carbohydrate esterase, sialic acid-specific acetylesterase